MFDVRAPLRRSSSLVCWSLIPQRVQLRQRNSHRGERRVVEILLDNIPPVTER
jgi:hypothetical protein